MSTATATAPVRNGNSAPAPAAPRPAWMSFSDAKQFEPAVQARAAEVLSKMRPMNLYSKSVGEQLAKLPADAPAYQKGFNFGEGEAAERTFAYFRDLAIARKSDHALAKTALAAEFPSVIADAIDEYTDLAQGRKDARDEEFRKQVLACMKCVNAKFSLTFFMKATSDANRLQARYQKIVGTAVSIGQQLNRYAKAVKDAGHGEVAWDEIAYSDYRSWQMGQVKPTTRAAKPTAPEAEPLSLDDMAGEW